MMRRRIFTAPNGHQALIEHNTTSDEFTIALRDASWDTWGPPLMCTGNQDDTDEQQATGARAYGPDGRDGGQ